MKKVYRRIKQAKNCMGNVKNNRKTKKVIFNSNLTPTPFLKLSYQNLKHKRNNILRIVTEIFFDFYR
jgi:hypothetical protein